MFEGLKPGQLGLRWDSKVYEKSLEKLGVFNLEKRTFKDNKILIFKGLKRLKESRVEE